MSAQVGTNNNRFAQGQDQQQKRAPANFDDDDDVGGDVDEGQKNGNVGYGQVKNRY